MEAAALPSPRLASRSINLPAAVLRLRSDEQLVALLRAGSDAAFVVIHDRYRARLLAYARQMLGGSQADAEDVLQDVFVRAHAALGCSDAPITLRAWLYRIAHNRCIDAIRRPGPMPAEIAPGAQPALSRGAQHDPPVEAERSEDLRRLVRDLLDLPEQQRSALLMRELQGLSYDELACSLGVSVGAVKSLLVRARAGVRSAAVARDSPCADIGVELAEAHDRGVRPSGPVRRHLRECEACRQHRVDLRTQSRQIAALGPPAGLLGLLSGLGGGTGGGLAVAGGGGAGTVAGGGAAAACGAGVVAVGKVAAIVCAAALVGGGATALTVNHAAGVVRPPTVAAAAPPRAPTIAASRHRSTHPRALVAVGPATAPANLTPSGAVCPAAPAAAPAPSRTDPSAAAPASAASATSTGAATSPGAAAGAQPTGADGSTTGAAASADPCAIPPSALPPAVDPADGPTPAPSSGQSAQTGPSPPAVPDPDQTTAPAPAPAATAATGAPAAAPAVSATPTADPIAATSSAAAAPSPGGVQAPPQQLPGG